MGVAGLWNILRPAGKTRSLTELSVTEGFEENPANLRGYRIGIDASIWFFHAEYGREGENPVLRTLFFRCATLMHSPFLPLFVFDGPLRPDFKRGKKINKASSKLIPGMKAIVEAFGFEWRTAPGEAEAELAYLNRIRVIDGILSDDVDNFLFGATTVIRNPSNNLSGNKANPVLNAAGKDDKNHTKVYRLADITAHPNVRLTRGGMILIGLMKGGDYHPGGLARCGPVIAHGLAKCGFGDTLFEAAKNLSREELVAFFVPWRHELRQEISTNSQGHIGKKHPALAKTIPDSFPDIDVLLSYVDPITSETMGKGDYYNSLTWGKEPDLGKLAANCELSFEWGYKEAIIKRFRTIIWHSVVLRILRRAALNMDAKAGHPQTLLTTPCKKGAAGLEPVGTPSKMIAKYFSSLTLGTLHGYPSDCEEGEDERLIIKIHSSRNHVSTDGILEYRLEIAPAQLVRITVSGIKGLRTPEGPDEWVDDLDDDDDEGGKKGTKKPPPNPESHMRVWMPACMVRLVEPGLVAEYEAIQAKKLERKSAKGRPKFGGKTQATVIPEPSLESPTSEGDFPIIKPKAARKATPKVQATSDPKAVAFSRTLSSKSIFIQDSNPERVIRDLTKKTAKPKNASNTHADLKSFFPSAKLSRTAAGKAITDIPVKHVPSPTCEIPPPKLSRDTSLSRDSPQTNLKWKLGYMSYP
ncbi:hypothetical protein BDZ94DRAFT_1238453 [Collybia nuda]|uniref:XPG-I domain-containing protein n=1 Tax=Collybia nuda TaxID=64659 RepID=A0A9P5XZH9_9AGAR|nr:hypothetical protein BDZ94DRAFT_1238453 [Collybia nuda]